MIKEMRLVGHDLRTQFKRIIAINSGEPRPVHGTHIVRREREREKNLSVIQTNSLDARRTINHSHFANLLTFRSSVA